MKIFINIIVVVSVVGILALLSGNGGYFFNEVNEAIHTVALVLLIPIGLLLLMFFGGITYIAIKYRNESEPNLIPTTQKELDLHKEIFEAYTK
jgi:uncharacterized membrane protein YbhN (UPF0104 family)